MALNYIYSKYAQIRRKRTTSRIFYNQGLREAAFKNKNIRTSWDYK